mmetsp:Transcript_12684/g.16666  ORF Transcript_12684/g.16666 Transcript_12684/m.16666 type:complete len:246 (-) Transcript_12684:47-784(-)
MNNNSNRRTGRVGGGITTSRQTLNRNESGSRFLTPISTQRSVQTSQRNIAQSKGDAKMGIALGSTQKRRIMGKTYNPAAAGTGYGRDLEQGSGNTTEQNRVYSDNTLLHPVWHKVTETPWTAGARVYAGYGRQVGDHSVSHEAPSHFHIPAVQEAKCKSSIGYLAREAKRSMTAPSVRHDTAVSGDAPTWFHIDKVQSYDPNRANENQPRFEKLLVGRTVVLEPESLKNFQRRTAGQNQRPNLYS